MSNIIIHTIDGFKTINNAPVFITGKKKLQEQEINENMWSIAFDQKALKDISLQDLTACIDVLINEKKRQIYQAMPFHPAVLYMWMDEMPPQLCFSLFSFTEDHLPFKGKIDLLDSPKPLLEEFLTSHYHDGIIPWEEIIFPDTETELKEEIDPWEKPLKVFVIYFK